MLPEKGFQIIATVKRVKGKCNACHKVGDRINVSARNTGGLCGYLYHDAFPSILMLQFGGSYPWDDPDAIELNCPDLDNEVTLELRRVK